MWLEGSDGSQSPAVVRGLPTGRRLNGSRVLSPLGRAVTEEWVDWHRNYDSDPTLRERLRTVQARLREALDRLPAGPVRLVSACAGDGRDVLGALDGHPRAGDVRALLVELSPDLVAAGRAQALRRGLRRVEFRQGDASDSSVYAGAVPADIVLLCGIFGNVSDADVRRSIREVRSLCAPSATVIWTRGRFAPDLTPTIRSWFVRAGYEELSFVTVPRSTKAVGANRLLSDPPPFRPGVRLFTFLPKEERPSSRSETPRRSSRSPTPAARTRRGAGAGSPNPRRSTVPRVRR